MTTSTSTVTASPLPRRKRRRSRPEPFTVISYIVVGFAGLCCLLPFWMIVAGSVTDETVLSKTGYSLWPSDFSLDAYQGIFSGTAIYNA
jgi:putative aldouronate transport system permease protein